MQADPRESRNYAEVFTYGFDAGHTEVRFFWDHAGVTEQSAEWGKVEGTVYFDPDDLAATTVSITIDPASVNTNFAALDKHMMSSDMFDVATFDKITFASTSVTQTGPRSVNLTGDLTIKDVTLPLTLHVDLIHQGEHPLGQYLDYYKGQWLGVHASGRLLRSAYGVGFGAPLTSDAIRLQISTEMKEK